MTIPEPSWLSEKAVKAIHQALIARTGGSDGILSENQLSSTLHRPKNTHFYEKDASVFRLAADYGYGFIKNHCFVDGNKRVALASVDVFLRKNGYTLTASEVEAATFFWDLSKTLETQDEAIERLTSWIANNVVALNV